MRKGERTTCESGKMTGIEHPEEGIFRGAAGIKTELERAVGQMTTPRGQSKDDR